MEEQTSEERKSEEEIKLEETKQKIDDMYEQLDQILYDLKNENNQLDSKEIIDYASWMLQKAEIKYKRSGHNQNIPIIYRRIYWAHMGVNIGSEENKRRPVLIIRATRSSPICQVVPLTTQRLNDKYWFHVDLDSLDNTALVEHFTTIS
ncbi:type II toxin-antitoxin system PemK/MazF family toxin, partial [Leifsonia shinshuensis]|uniref:type II toxin-antitoxin system PemK/MazF family toxin n=1 Tax=Leifsonia shinshuensis TaxID=150026 RepID=UPI0035EC590B